MSYVDRLKRALQRAWRRGDVGEQALIRAELDRLTRRETR